MDAATNLRLKLIKALGAAVAEAQGGTVQGYDVIELGVTLYDLDGYHVMHQKSIQMKS